MKKCSICLEHKVYSLNRNFNCDCSIFVCNICSNKLLSSNSIYAICPQCRNNKSYILNKTICNKTICNKTICNKIKYYLILLRDILITFILWFLFLDLIGYYMISQINSDYIIIHTEKINKFVLYLVIQPIVGLFTFLFVGAYLVCSFCIVCE
jgi:hypothetical protein